jgi:hypothetical protein
MFRNMKRIFINHRNNVSRVYIFFARYKKIVQKLISKNVQEIQQCPYDKNSEVYKYFQDLNYLVHFKKLLAWF